MRLGAGYISRILLTRDPLVGGCIRVCKMSLPAVEDKTIEPKIFCDRRGGFKTEEVPETTRITGAC